MLKKPDPVLSRKVRFGDINLHKAPERIVPSHHHEQLEINLVKTGRARYNVNDRIYELLPHTLVFLFPDQEHVLYERSDDFSMWNITVRQSFLRSFCRNKYLKPLMDRDPGVNFCRMLEPSAFLLHDRLVENVHAQKVSRPVLYRLGLSYLVGALWRDFHENSTAVAHTPVTPHVERAVRLMVDSDPPMSLRELAKALHLEESQLSRIFKKETGITITHFRNRIRIDRFVKLLELNPEYDLLALALESGFGSYTQFYRVFMKEIRISPEDFRLKYTVVRGFSGRSRHSAKR